MFRYIYSEAGKGRENCASYLSLHIFLNYVRYVISIFTTQKVQSLRSDYILGTYSKFKKSAITINNELIAFYNARFMFYVRLKYKY